MSYELKKQLQIKILDKKINLRSFLKTKILYHKVAQRNFTKAHKVL